MISIVGIGPGSESMMTHEAIEALERADVIIGYTVYIDLLNGRCADKEVLSTPMTQEAERCRMCFEQAAKGKDVALICSGDAGIYGLASLMFEFAGEYGDKTDICVIPGVTAASSGAALLGAPLNHDFCVISLSDRLTSWEVIEKRLRAAAAGDFVIAIYNPSSRGRQHYLRRACDILLESLEADRICGYVRNIGRKGTERSLCTLAELRDTQVDMFTTVFIGNSQSKAIGDRLVTPRGYRGI